MARSDACSTSQRIAEHRDHHVRPCRPLRALGATPSAHPPAAARDGRLHRVRAAAVRAYGSPDLSQGPLPAWPHFPGGRADARDRPPRAAPADHQHPDLLGEDGPRGRENMSAQRRQRPWRHIDGRDHHPFGRCESRTGDDASRNGEPHSLTRPRPPPARYALPRRPAGALPRLLRGGARLRAPRRRSGLLSAIQHPAPNSIVLTLIPIYDAAWIVCRVQRRGLPSGCNSIERSRIGPMTEPFLIRPEILDGDRRRRAVEGLRAAQVTLPSWSELADPARIPAAIVSSLKSAGPDEPDAKNLWRVHWFNDVDRRDRVPVPGHVVLPEALTGVKAPVVVLLGRRFPMIGAHKVLAAYACLVPRLVTGQFEPTHDRAVWPSTGNYCRGGVAISRILGCRGVAVLPAGMSRERFDWLQEWVSHPGDIIRTPGTESNVKEIYDKCDELARDQHNVILSQFSEFANYLIHYHCTGAAFDRVFAHLKRGAGAVIVDQIIGEFGELVENDVVLVARELVALVVDFLDVAFRSRRANDVAGMGDPFLQPVEALPAHAGGQHGHAAAAQNARYGNAAAAIISGRRPHRSVMRRLELASHQARHQTRIGGEHLVRADHGKAPSQEDHDRRLHAGQRLGQDHMPGHRHSIAAVNVVEPVHAPEVFRIGLIRAGRFEAAYDRGR